MPAKPTFPVYISSPGGSIRIMAIILLFAIFHYVAGYRLIYSLGILYAKEDAKECMLENNNHVRKLTLSGTDYHLLKWTEEKKEFSLNNELYDVVSIQKSGKVYIITVYCDERETRWVSALHNYEKDFFHPDQETKGTKSAEDVMSSFQKDFTPETEFKISIITPAGSAQQRYLAPIWPGQIKNAIWHPPTGC